MCIRRLMSIHNRASERGATTYLLARHAAEFDSVTESGDPYSIYPGPYLITHPLYIAKLPKHQNGKKRYLALTF